MTTIQAPELPKLRILLIDDDRSNAPTLYQLMGYEHDYTHALTVDDGLAKIAQSNLEDRPFDVVYLSYMFASTELDGDLTQGRNLPPRLIDSIGESFPMIMWLRSSDDTGLVVWHTGGIQNALKWIMKYL